MRVIHARLSPLPVFFFLFCLYFVSACSSFFYFGLCMPIFSFLSLRMKNSNRQIRRLHAYVTNKSTPCKPTCCILLHHFRKIDTSELFERKSEDIST